VAKFQRISANAIAALKDALAAVFWYRNDLYRYLKASVPDQRLLAGIGWSEQYKRDSIEEFIDRLGASDDQNREVLLHLMADISAMDDFPALHRTEDRDQKVADAKEAVERLRTYFKPYEAALLEEEQARARIEQKKAEGELKRATSTRLAALKARFYELLAMDNPQRRGFDFEPFLRELFNTFDLDPKASFKPRGEQVDGGFTLDGTHFLLEARWRQDAAERGDLDIFKAKVEGKAENTLGLFISVEGFSPEGVEMHNGRQSPLLLMDGGEVLAVLEERIDLVDLLRLKHRHAAMTGEIYFTASQILA
jgi:hypothetical protein